MTKPGSCTDTAALDTHHHSGSESGQATAFLMVMATALLLLAAFVFDAGAALAERNRTLHLAQEAARAGAQQVDLALYRETGQVSLDSAAAAQAAESYLEQAGVQGQAAVEADVVTVTAQSTYAFQLLPVADRPASGTASATPTTDPDAL